MQIHFFFISVFSVSSFFLLISTKNVFRLSWTFTPRSYWNCLLFAGSPSSGGLESGRMEELQKEPGLKKDIRAPVSYMLLENIYHLCSNLSSDFTAASLVKTYSPLFTRGISNWLLPLEKICEFKVLTFFTRAKQLSSFLLKFWFIYIFRFVSVLI